MDDELARWTARSLLEATMRDAAPHSEEPA
jgi:hypothetical protein